LYNTELHGLLVADGMHRLEALRCNNVKQALCEVRMGTRADCFNASVSSNLAHGVRRTSADKRQSIATAIAIYPEVADLKIADLCHVSHSTVAEVRRKLETSGTITKRETIKTSDNKTSPAHKEKRLPIRQSPAISAGDVPKTMAVGVAVPPGNKSVADAPVVVDATGYPIPEKALPIWERKFEVIALVDDLREVRHELDGYATAKDILMSEVNLNAADCELESLISRLQGAIPYAVCPMCQGKLPEKCKGCGGRGMVSKARYDRTDENLKKVRSMAIKNARPS
jgi:hypothetical protein